MKRPWLILVGGLLLAVAGYSVLYLLGTAHSRQMAHSEVPELQWLKEEFHLGDAEFARVCDMHRAYLTGCAERCQKIDAKNAEINDLLAASATVTPEIEKMLNDAALMRAECQKQMLRHFYEVSRTMPPDQAKRYLAWARESTILPDTHSQMVHHHHSAAH